MSSGSVDLNSLLLDFPGLPEGEIEGEGIRLYNESFITRNGRTGALNCHDGTEVLFFADRYDHAFKTSPDRARMAYSKGKIAVDRIERLHWIKPLLEGRVPKSECWEVPLKVQQEGKRPFPGKRLYISWEHQYLVWVEPLKNGKFKFSTAYCNVPFAEIRRYLQRSRRIWAVPAIDEE